MVKENDIWAFEVGSSEPNFITLNIVEGDVLTDLTQDLSVLKNKILFIPSADPGYDWIFSHQIAGFVTMYGGANSHMAIRAGELGMPAVIGAGETLFKSWSSNKRIEINCASKKITVLI